MSQINEFIAHMEKPFTHLPIVRLSLICTECYVYASHSIRRFIFISVAAWYIVYRVAWAWHTSLLRTETIRISLSEMVNEWTTVNILCSFHSEKILLYIFFFTFGGKSQRRLNERELLFPSIVREVFDMIKKREKPSEVFIEHFTRCSEFENVNEWREKKDVKKYEINQINLKSEQDYKNVNFLRNCEIEITIQKRILVTKPSHRNTSEAIFLDTIFFVVIN